jgi:hypothetical protein
MGIFLLVSPGAKVSVPSATAGSSRLAGNAPKKPRGINERSSEQDRMSVAGLAIAAEALQAGGPTPPIGVRDAKVILPTCIFPGYRSCWISIMQRSFCTRRRNPCGWRELRMPCGTDLKSAQGW